MKALENFKKEILQGIPSELPKKREYKIAISHSPKRKHFLTNSQQKLAIKNALRYFDKKYHTELAKEFKAELDKYGRIYMYRFCPDYEITARKIDDFPHRSTTAAAIMMMISNNLDKVIAQFPEELITYGTNGAVFQNWAQYRITMKYLAEMNDEQTLVLYSGHPLGLFPSNKDAPRVVITNGMVIPNYSKQKDYDEFNALGVSQYGQMTAGSFMYIGPQGIVHGTAITIMNAVRILEEKNNENGIKLFVSSGLGGMSGAQPKAAVIANVIGVIAEINPQAAKKRYKQGWVGELHENLDELIERIRIAKKNNKATSLAYIGNIVDLWEKLSKENIKVDIGTDQTSLHNPFDGGYYPAGFSFEEANDLLKNDSKKFKTEVQKSLRRQVEAINSLTKKGMYFFDYGNAFLLQSKESGADIINEKDSTKYKYQSYIQDIMGPLYFDYGFGPFRWVCASSSKKDLEITDKIATKVMTELLEEAPLKIKKQISDNLKWIKDAAKNNLVVGSQARILYSNEEGRIRIAKEFNKAVADGRLSAPIILGRDHHDVSGTDSHERETSNIYDGSNKTADMAIQNVIGDAFRGASWVSIHNGGGVGWGEVINGGFGLVLDGSKDADRKLESMLFWDVNNGIARRNWARNENSVWTIKQAMKRNKNLKVTIPNFVDEENLKF